MTHHIPSLLAHAGHPGPAHHGDLTHFLLGVAIALPLLIGAALWIRHRRHTAQANAKKD